MEGPPSPIEASTARKTLSQFRTLDRHLHRLMPTFRWVNCAVFGQDAGGLAMVFGSRVKESRGQVLQQKA